jgi:hypothetical protein
MFKKIAIGLGVLVVLVIGALLLIPMFYSIDSLRPQVEQAIQKQIKGEVKLGHLSLSLFPTVKLGIDGLTLTPPAPFQNQPVVQVPHAELSMPLSSLIAAPRAVFTLEKPGIHIASQGEKSSLSAVLPEPKEEQKSAPLGETLNALPSWLGSRIKSARLAVAIDQGEVEMTSLGAPKGTKTALHGLNVKITNIGLNAPMGLHVDVLPDVASGALSASGPVSVDGTIVFAPVGKNNEITLDVESEMQKMDVKFEPFMHKPAGTPFAAALKGKIVQGESTTIDLPSITLKFGNANVKGEAKMVQAVNPAESQMSAAFAVNNFAIGPFGALVPMIRQYNLKGNVDLDLKVSGSSTEPAVNVAVALKNVSGATPQLKKPLTNLNGRIVVAGTAKNPKLSIDPLSMKIGASDLSLKVNTEGLDPIAANVSLSSNLLNVDELMGLTPAGAASSTDQASGADAKEPPAVPLDDSLDKMAPVIEEALKNPMLDKVSASVDMNVARIRILGADFRGAVMKVSYAKRALVIPKAELTAFKGKVGMDMRLDLDPKAMGYNMSAALTNVSVGEVVNSQMPSWKNQISGDLVGNLKIAGRGLRKQQLNQNLSGMLKGELKNGKTSLPIVKLVGSVIDALPKFAEKPATQAAEKQKFSGEFKTAKLDTEIKGRNVHLKEVNMAFDTLNTKLGALEYKGSGNLSFDRKIDMTGIAYMSPKVIPVAQLKGPSGQIEIPLKFAGDMSDPKPDIAYTLKIIGPRLAKGIAQNEAKKLLKQPKVQAQIKKLEQKAPAPVKKQLDKLKKKFGF